MEKGGGAKVELIEGGGINNDHFLYFPSARDVSERKLLTHKDVGHWLDMVYLPPRGNFVDHIFLKAQCLARLLQHVSPLTMAALSCNSLLHMLPYKIFDNKNSF